MTNLNNLEIVNVDYGLDSGFFWVELDNNRSLQCCLIQSEDGEYIAAVNSDDMGASWGICGDNNEWAVNDDEWGPVESFLIEHARQNGMEIR